MKRNILFLAAECVPFFKTGGLADVIGSLPLVLSNPETEIKVFLPFYNRLADFRDSCRASVSGKLEFGGRKFNYRVLSLFRGKTEFLFLDVPELFDREAIYGPPGRDYPDSVLRFGFFSWAALRLLPDLEFQPDIVHCHDWHTATAPVYLKEVFSTGHFYRKIKSVITIHNLGYQGIFPRSDWPMLSLPEKLFSPEGFEFFGKINLLKAGLLWADRITTVSPTYSREIRTAEFGQGLEGLLQRRSGQVSGILNGLDYKYWNPETDPLLKDRYGADDSGGKIQNKEELLRQFGLGPARKPLLGVVSRLVPPKGFDLIGEALPKIVQQGFNLAILGSGLPKYEELFKRAAAGFKNSVGFQSGYNENLAHLIYAGSDFFLMPSLFEPCGLGQMIALRYGTVPIVRQTGGLADSVADFTGSSGNGFLFQEPVVSALLNTLKKSRAVFENKPAWQKLLANAFRSDFSWNKSALEYRALYRSLDEKENP